MTRPVLVGSVLYGADAHVVDFVKRRIPHMRDRDFGPASALGVVDQDGIILGGVVFHAYRPQDGDIEMSAAFDHPRWAMPQTLRHLFRYPFVQLNCIRMTTITPRGNKRARRFDEGLGFKLEGVLRKAVSGQDAMIYGMLRSECRWLKKG